MTATVAANASPASPGLFTRLFGIIFSPRDTYAAVAARPRWLGMMLITVAVGAAAHLAIGLGVLYRRRTRPIAAALLSVYVLIALIVAMVRS